jgi:hypothetical protein
MYRCCTLYGGVQVAGCRPANADFQFLRSFSMLVRFTNYLEE